ncbi:hypothetical protein [Jannaschia pohangensis]|uniref:Avidin family protein n=1 Tax=Jannaschia pohangensis TaxID=390807 RepID=A0A1I3ILC1_9RHOB|nr:hypothetical protein [Jannaschia pohangensis]SFI48573.1 hypothetical protein SAMN04488095_1014 [Jannaschia pohangensis]
MNLPTIKAALAVIACLGLWTLDATAEGPTSTQWEAETHDPDRFAGSVIVTEDGDARTLSYSFVFDSQILSTNHLKPATLEALGAACWRANVTGDFLQGVAETMEVQFCERDDHAYWTLLDGRGGAVRLPNWVRFAQ